MKPFGKYTKRILVLWMIFSPLWGFTAPGDTSEEDDGQIHVNEDAPERSRAYVPSPTSAGLDIQYAFRNYSNYVWSPGVNGGGGGYAADIGVEWIPFTRFGKLGVGVAAGFYSLNNNTVGSSITQGTQYASLYTIPVDVTATYRLDFTYAQFLVPYVKIGPNITYAMQNSNYGLGRQIPVYFGLNLGGGLGFCLTGGEPTAARTLDANFGINATYLTVEFLTVTPLVNPTSGNDLSHQEVRVGFRFEM